MEKALNEGRFRLAEKRTPKMNMVTDSFTWFQPHSIVKVSLYLRLKLK